MTEWDLAGSVARRVSAVASSLDDFDTELPVPLTTFVTDRRYLGNPPLSAEQYEAVRHAERVYLPDTYPLLAGCDDRLVADYWAQPCRLVNFLDLEWGKGAGKDHSVRIMNLRVVYLLLCLRSPQEYFCMPEQDTIHTLNVATSSAQAGRAFFAPMRRAVTRKGNWFQHVSEAVEAGASARKEARALLNLIRFDKNVEAISGHSDADSQEGLNLIFGVADEVDGFKSQAELEKERGARARESASSAEAILNMLRTSASPQPLDALVLTPGGWKRMGDIRVGDQVVDPEGAQSVVEGVYPQGVQPVYRLTFSDGTSCEATGLHRWAVDRRTMKRAISPRMRIYREILTTEDLRWHLLANGKGKSHPIWLPDAPVLRSLDFPEEALFIDPYLLGLLLGDGGLTHYTPQLTTEDDEIEEQARNVLPAGMRLVPGARSGNARMFNLVNGKGRPNPLTQELKRLGLWGLRSHEKYVPWQYKYASAATRLAVLQGLMDTDGYNSQGNMGGFDSTSEALRDDVIWLARSLGLKAVKWKDEESPAGPAERLSHLECREAGITLARRTSYAAGIEEVPEVRLFRLSRKLRSTFGNRRFKRRLISVEYAGETECQCIAVSAESRLYLTDDFIPTHNTRFPKTYKNVRISYPRYLGSTIQKLIERGRLDNETRGERSRHYVSGPKCTWEVNPRVSKDDFEQDYEDDPVLARAKYECRPGRAVNPYFGNELAIRSACFAVPRQPIVIVDYVRDAGAWAPFYDYAPPEQFRPIQGARYAIHADLSVRGDRAGVAMSHIVKWEERQAIGRGPMGENVFLTETRPVVKTDFVISYEADASREPPLEIQLRWFRQLTLDLRTRGFNIVQASMDGYQSTDTAQILQAHGIECKIRSTDRTDEHWASLRDVAYEGRWTMPLRELAVTELLGLSRLPNGKIDHLGDGCFVGSTRVPLLDGREVQIQELADGCPVWVYGSDDQGRIVPALAVGRRTKQVRHLCDVVLDTGAVVRCTPEHLWRLRDGSYKEAQALIKTDRLMPLKRKWDFNSGYEKVRDLHGRESWTHILVREYLDGRPLARWEVSHHDNEIKTDNRPDNLVRMTSTEHKAHHARKRHATDPEYVGSLRAAQRAYWSSPEAKERQAEVARESNRRRSNIREYHAGRMDQLRSVLDAKSVGEAARRVGLPRNSAVTVLRLHGFSGWEDFKARDGENHKIRFVERVELEEPVWVYDLEVDGFHNFALTAGVFVHNSKDEADAVACSISGALEVLGQEDEDGAQAWPGGRLESWSGSPLFRLPLGFVPPQMFRPDEVMPQQVAVDGRGMPMWLPGVQEGGEHELCPCRGADGVPRCMECRADSVPRMQ